MNLIKPNSLKSGDTIGILALSGNIDKTENPKANILRAQKYFQDKGYKVVLSDNIFTQNRYLAGTDEQKVAAMHNFFADPKINMILCARGGYGAIRLLDKINFDIIKSNPKIFAGYSDTSAIHTMILKNTGLITFYAPMALGDFGAKKVSKFTETSFFNAVQNIGQPMELAPKNPKIYHSGTAEAMFWGGNLMTLASMAGLDFLPEEKFILFIEDLNEPVYKIDRMISQLLNLPNFKQNLAGIALGDFLDIDNQQYFDELFIEIGNKLQIPITSGFKLTHAQDKITVPYGVQAKLSGNNLILC